MKDILRELQSLSLKLQRREMTLVDSSVHIKQTINVLTAMKTTGGRSTKKAEQGASSGFFKDSRNRLREDSLSSLLFVDLNGPPLDKFDPVPFVKSWIKAGHRLSSSWKPGRQREEVEPRHLWSILT
ncbi:E3 SUMO-protein ligase KIAA1586 [Dissostichus eleginoides]|uniref:E3 SUMO-protein ligase KIAA1586 n=1 Tax=Dissostichus eleginoides TaxID=100907 RepID=A0AAD9ETK5_DISEL|nr:E3 SUMO-protein ligase KIAA1586 [Dissostichus eleginoides]